MGFVKKAMKKLVNKLNGTDEAKKALRQYEQRMEDAKKYDPSKPLEGFEGSVDQGGGGARDDLTQSVVQGSGGSLGSVVSSGNSARAQYFARKNKRARGSGSVNY